MTKISKGKNNTIKPIITILNWLASFTLRIARINQSSKFKQVKAAKPIIYAIGLLSLSIIITLLTSNTINNKLIPHKNVFERVIIHWSL